MLYIRLICLLILSCTTLTNAQDYTVQGIVLDADGRAVEYANILLLQQSDSTIVKGMSTEVDGTFVFTDVQDGNYVINISYLGYVKLDIPIEVKGNLDTGPHYLEELRENLDEINIIAKRPTLKREPDRLTFNVASTALIEGNILQVLKNTPSLLVIDGDIRIKNSSADVYINNRKVQLSSDELSEFLESSAANSIQSIEVINNPPASFDASSGAVINIVMSKNLVSGYRGTVSANYEQGVYPRYTLSTSHFFKGENTNFNISYTYNDDKTNRENNDAISYFDNTNSIDEIWLSNVKRTTYSDIHNLNFNYDYTIDEQNSLAVTSILSYMPFFEYRINNITNITDQNGDLQTLYIANNDTDDDKYNLNFDLDYVHKLKKGQLSLNGHLTLYDYNRFQFVENEYYNNNNVLFDELNFNTDNNQNTTILSGKLDYNLPVNDSTSVDAGIKYSAIKTESDIVRQDIINGQEQINTNFTDAFDYDEQIAAAYINLSKEWNTWSINVGLRAENTEIKGVSLTNNSTNNQSYFNLFPNASILYQASENVGIYANYKRSIQRPSYSALNPFTFFLNENTLVVGNPRLQPVVIDHWEVGTEFLKYFTVAAYYKVLDNNFYEIPRQDNDTNIITYTNLNVDKTVDFGFDFTYASPILDNWYLYFVTSFYNWSDSINFGQNFVELDRWANFSILTNSWSFLEDKSLSVYLNLIFVGKTVQGLQTVDDRLFSDLSISKDILKGKGTLSLSAGDLFNAQDPRAVTNYLDQFNIYDTDIDSRFVSLGFRYRFGNTKLETNERETESNETKRLSPETVKEQEN